MRHEAKKHEGLNGMLLDNVRYYNNRHMTEHTLIPTKMSLDALVCKRAYSQKKVHNICILWEVWLQRIKDSFPHQSVIIFSLNAPSCSHLWRRSPGSHLVDLINESHLHICFIIRCKGIHRETIFPWPQNTNTGLKVQAKGGEIMLLLKAYL